MLVHQLPQGVIIRVIIPGLGNNGSLYRLGPQVPYNPEQPLSSKREARKQFTGEKVTLHPHNRCEIVELPVDGFPTYRLIINPKPSKFFGKIVDDDNDNMVFPIKWGIENPSVNGKHSITVVNEVTLYWKLINYRVSSQHSGLLTLVSTDID